MPAKRKKLEIAGSNLWYLVGLITTDGSLSSDGRHIDITSSDYKFLLKIKNSLRLRNKVGVKYGSKRKKAFRIQIANKNFYDFLLSIGLTQSKSLNLDTIKVPNQFFIDFLRGVIDGDGCIRRWIHPSNNREQWSLRIYSGSGIFIEWLKDTIASLLKIQGKIYRETATEWILKYGKMAARIIVQKCYYDGSFALERKRNLAKECIRSYRGWKKSKTVSAQ